MDSLLEIVRDESQAVYEAKSPYVKSLDLGTGSIGWAIVNALTSEILFTGVEIFPTDKAGCQDRTTSRQIRKGYKRRRQRKNNTAKFLKETFSLDTLPVPPLNIWKLRAKAVTQPVTLMELAQIIQHIANHRGFSSTAKGFKDADTDFLKAMENVETELKNSSFETLSQYIRHKQREDKRKGNNLFAVRGNNELKINRRLHLQELAVIWEKQKKFNPEYTKILTDELLEKLTTESRNIHQNGHSLNFRRNLKSQNDKVSKCLYFPKKKATPVFCPEFEEFRLLKFVHSLQAFEYSNGVYSESLDEEIKEYLLDKWLFTSTASVKLSKLRKDGFFGEYYTEGYKLNYPDGSEKGEHNTSVPVSKIGYLLGKLFGKSGAKAVWCNYMDTSKEHRANTLLGKFCHYLRHSTRAMHNYTASEKLAYLEKLLTENTEIVDLSLSKKSLDILDKFTVPQSYGKYSLKVLNTIKEYLEQGYDEQNALKVALGDLYVSKQGNKGKLALLKNHEVMNPAVKKTLNRMVLLIKRLQENPEIAKLDIQNVVVETTREMKANKEKRGKIHKSNKDREKINKLYQAMMKYYVHENGLDKYIPTIKFKLWVELGGAGIHEVPTKTKYKEQYQAFKKFCGDATEQDFEKYLLWKEAKMACPYSGKMIGLADLFSSNTEIEHIFPKSLSFDNSFLNKTVCWRSENQDKGQRTAMAYMDTKSQKEQYMFKARIERIFPKNKQDRFLTKEIPDGFINRQLTDTAYITKKAMQMLRGSYSNVIAVNGNITNFFRHVWGGKGNPLPKNRLDNRHHAEDAMLMAFVGRNMVQLLNHHTGKGGHLSDEELRKVPFLQKPVPDILHRIQVAKSNIIVNHTRSLKKNGQFHDETVYRKEPDGKFTVKKPYDIVTKGQLPKIYGEHAKQAFTDAFATDKVKKGVLVKPPVHPVTGKPIRKVKLMINAKSGVKASLREIIKNGKPTGKYVDALTVQEGAIYRNSKGKNVLVMLKLLDAMYGKTLSDVAKEKGGIEYVCSANIGDLFLFGVSPDEIKGKPVSEWQDNVYRVTKRHDKDNSLVMLPHWYSGGGDKEIKKQVTVQKSVTFLEKNLYIFRGII